MNACHLRCNCPELFFQEPFFLAYQNIFSKEKLVMIFIRYLLLQFKVYLPIKQENTNNFVLLSLIAAPSVSVAGEEKEPSFYDNCYFDSDSDEEGTSEGMYVW